jgi:hypothetical protein
VAGFRYLPISPAHLLAGHPDALDRAHLWLEQNQGLGLWLTGLATVGLLVGVILAGFAVRDAKRTRHGQVLIDLYRQMAAPEMVASFTEYVAYTPDELAALASKFFDPHRAPPSNAEEAEADSLAIDALNQLTISADFIELVGVLEFEGAITSSAIYNAWGGQFMHAWMTWELAVPRFRYLRQQEDIWQHFERISKELLKIKVGRDGRRGRTGLSAKKGSASPEGASAAGHTSEQSSDLQSSGSNAWVLVRSLAGLVALSLLAAFATSIASALAS